MFPGVSLTSRRASGLKVAFTLMSEQRTDILVLGTGIAGCAAALAAARASADVLLVSRAADPHESSTFYAQGGIVGRPAGDTAEALAADIEKAGLMEEENIGTK